MNDTLNSSSENMIVDSKGWDLADKNQLLPGDLFMMVSFHVTRTPRLLVTNPTFEVTVIESPSSYIVFKK